MLCLCLSFLSCGEKESEAEREYKEALKAAEQAEQVANQAEKEYNELKNALEQLQQSQNSLNNSCGHQSCKENGPFYCVGKNNTCPNKTYCAYDLYCDKCD